MPVKTTAECESAKGLYVSAGNEFTAYRTGASARGLAAGVWDRAGTAHPRTGLGREPAAAVVAWRSTRACRLTRDCSNRLRGDTIVHKASYETLMKSFLHHLCTQSASKCVENSLKKLTKKSSKCVKSKFSSLTLLIFLLLKQHVYSDIITVNSLDLTWYFFFFTETCY